MALIVNTPSSKAEPTPHLLHGAAGSGRGVLAGGRAHRLSSPPAVVAPNQHVHCHLRKRFVTAGRLNRLAVRVEGQTGNLRHVEAAIRDKLPPSASALTHVLSIDVIYQPSLRALVFAGAAFALTLLGAIPPAVRAARLNIVDAVAVD